MGSTVFNQAKIFSFKTHDDRIGYVWTEETYDRKEGPESANWCVMGIGYREQMVERIFTLAQSIPGGMLKVKNTSAKAFITAMLEQLKSPTKLLRTSVSLENSADGFYAAVKDSNRAAVRAVFERMGRSDLSAAVEHPREQGGQAVLDLDLARDLDVLVALTARGMKVPKWTVMRHPHGFEPGPSEPAPPTSTRRLQIELLNVQIAPTVDSDNYYLMMINGEPKKLGLPYEVEQTLIAFAAARESEFPGLYKSLLNSYHAKTASVEPAPPDLAFHIDATRIDKWAQSHVLKLPGLLGRPESLSYSVTLEEIGSALANQPADHVRGMVFQIHGVLENPNATRIELPALAELDNEPPVRQRG